MTKLSEIFKNIQEPVNLYFVRHGESEGNSQGRVQGHIDSPLTDLGRTHANSAGKWLKEQLGSKKVHVCTSPLTRAFETASIIASHIQVDKNDIEKIDGLKELKTGIFSGMNFQEIEERYPEHFASFLAESWEAVPEAESIQSLCDRAIEHWIHLAKHVQEEKRAIISVSHGGILQWIFKTSLNHSWDAWTPILHIENCSIFHLEIRPTGQSKSLGYWKQINHRPY